MQPMNAFYQHQLYPVSLDRYFKGQTDRYMLYSPLAHSLIVADGEQMEQWCQQLQTSGRLDDEALNQALIGDQVVPRPNYVTSPRDVFALTILPNNICNFACSYCYAAKGHGHDELSDGVLDAVLQYFIDPQRLSRRDLYISFGGGGEPLLSWPKVKRVLQRSDELARLHGFTIGYSYASNGSVMSPEILQAIDQYKIKVNVSFDILEDIQNVQRRHYGRVCQTLDTLLAHGVRPTINSVITPLNVERQCEMVEQVHERFPQLQRLSFDYVVDGQLFHDPALLTDFYERYTRHFFRAQALGRQYGISVSSIKHHNLEQHKTRACAGGFDLTPQGKLSMCFFVSSPREPLYHDFIYGEVTPDGGVTFDEAKFRSLVDSSANDREPCSRCFLRWHCGGGCLYHAKSYTPQLLEVMCEFQRRFSLVSLLSKAAGKNVWEEEPA